jgi:signal transduction histidine kinase
MDARHLVALPWPVLLVGADGTVEASVACERLLGFQLRDIRALEQQIQVVSTSGTLLAEEDLPWRRPELPFDRREVWRHRRRESSLAVRVHGSRVEGGRLLALEVEEPSLVATNGADQNLAGIHRSLSNGEPVMSLQGVLRLLVEVACEFTGARFGALGVLAGDQSRLKDFVYVGLSEEEARRIGHLPEGHGLLGAVIREGRTIRVDQVAADPRSSGWPSHHPPMRSFLGVPLRIGSRVFGNFYLTDKHGGVPFTEEDAGRLERFSEQAAAVVAFAEHVEQEERLLFRSLVEHAPYGMAFFPAGQGEPFGNQAAERILGRIRSGPETAGDYQLVRRDGTPFPREEEPERRALGGEALFNLEAQVVRPERPHLPVLLSAAPVRADEGGLIGTVVVYQDISTLKELERLREEFTAIVAHDMRTPVQAVMLRIEALLQRATGEAAWVPVTTLENMRRNTQHLNQLISDLLDAARLDARRMPIQRQLLDAEEQLRKLLLRLQPALGGHKVVITAEGRPSVYADPLRFDQILTNLIENAGKYSGEGRPIRIALSARAGGTCIEVEDEGPGIPPEELPHLFDRYWRGRAGKQHRPGLGLGLYIAHALAEVHGGRLRATSTLGVGSAFELWLPGKVEPGQPRAAPSGAHPA